MKEKIIELLKKKYIVFGIISLVLALGITYAWFTYYKVGNNRKLIAGNLYLTMSDNGDELSLSNVFPETKEEARSRDNNFVIFTVSGLNNSDSDIKYEIGLNYGTSKTSEYERYNDKDLVFDLVELDSSNNEVRYLLDAVSYETLNNAKIWTDEVASGTNSEINKKYKLRMWLSDTVTISDTDPNATYKATGAGSYQYRYASIKYNVFGDFTDKTKDDLYARYGYQKVLKAIDEHATGTCQNIKYVEDGITYFSGTNDCINFNYVWYSGKLWRITAIYPDGTMKLITENNITSIAFNESGSNFYTDANATSYMYQWLNEDFYDTLYQPEKFIDTTKRWNATMSADTDISTKPAESNMIDANVGLLNSYEYYNSYRCVGSNACTGSSYSTGYLNIGYYWWLLNPYDTSNVWCVNSGGYGDFNYQSGTGGGRPSINLKSGLEFTGDGSKLSPYKIKGDKETGKQNDLINTRLSGEYVKLVNNENEQVFRIIGVEDNKTKIIAMDYADNKGTRKFATSTGTANTLWGSGTTKGTDTWYEYLNRVDNSDISNTGYYDMLVKTYGELFTSGTYYLGTTSGNNYKLSVCANTTSGNTKVCDKTSGIGTFNIGLPRYGEMFATQQGTGYSNSIDMWLMNRSTASYVWVVYNGSGNPSDPTNAYGGRPTLHLKSTVKILSGSGTEQDPYIVGCDTCATPVPSTATPAITPTPGGTLTPTPTPPMTPTPTPTPPMTPTPPPSCSRARTEANCLSLSGCVWNGIRCVNSATPTPTPTPSPTPRVR